MQYVRLHPAGIRGNYVAPPSDRDAHLIDFFHRYVHNANVSEDTRQSAERLSAREIQQHLVSNHYPLTQDHLQTISEATNDWVDRIPSEVKFFDADTKTIAYLIVELVHNIYLFEGVEDQVDRVGRYKNLVFSVIEGRSFDDAVKESSKFPDAFGAALCLAAESGRVDLIEKILENADRLEGEYLGLAEVRASQNGHLEVSRKIQAHEKDRITHFWYNMGKRPQLFTYLSSCCSFLWDMPNHLFE